MQQDCCKGGRMEIANKVAKDNPNIGSPPVPSKVRTSTLPDAESTRTPAKDAKGFRKNVDRSISEPKKEEPKEEVKEVFSKPMEPEIVGTIVVTVYKNHPYDVEFSGSIKGSERDLAIKFIYKGYAQWKHKLAMANEKKLKNKENEDA